MKRKKKVEGDKALWLNDEQALLLEKYKRRIKQQEEQQRADVADGDCCQRCGEPISNRRRIDVGIHRQARYCSQKCVDAAIKACAEERKRREEQQRAERKRREEQQRAERKQQEEQQRVERKQQEEQQRERRRILDLFKKAMNPKVSACFPLPKLNEDDKRLVEKWNQSPQNSINWKSLIESKRKDGELGRLLSARSAEKIATDFYQRHGKTVEDVSITQIDKNNNPDWKDYDLNVDGCHIDVKNSRKSQKSKDRYTEYCIPKFKKGRRTNQEVRIAGVFSPYLWAFELLDEPVEHHQDREIQFLGETTLEKQRELEDEFNGDLLDFSRPDPSSKYFLPPWMFDYPQYIYTKRNKALKELKGFSSLDSLKETTAKRNLIPVAIAAGIDLTKILDQKDLSCWEWSFLDRLNNRIEKYGLSLPFLFLTILSHFLDMASSPKTVSDPDFDPENYREFLFYNSSNNKPLGIYDPLKTIDALIKALKTLWTAENEKIRVFRVFKLVSFNILQGKCDQNENTWTTLIAYCSCGNNPLVLGKSKLCECLRLICPECGFCCEDEWACRCEAWAALTGR